jgi:UDP-GlcNAc:undecaprenyl-phosphate/decaprenyl-phosphate GlcNAc-1-phosphate transferase
MPFLLAAVFGIVLTPLARRVGLAAGLVDRPGDALHIHAVPVPYLGGVVVLGAAFGAAAAVGSVPDPSVWVSAGVMLAAGLLDDRWGLPAWVRLVIQAGAGVILVAGGFDLEALGLAASAGMVLVVMASANAVNMVDGQDALAGGLSLIAALGLAILASWGGAAVLRDLAIGLAGGLFAFLVWNRPPARIFLGNGGAYGVGLVLALLAASAVDRLGWSGILAAGACLGIFAFDLVFTVGRRLVWRRRMFPGDRFHSYDIVAEKLGRNRSTLVFWVAGLAAAGLGLLIGLLPPSGGLLVLAVGFAVAAAGAVWLWSRLGGMR